MLFPNPEIRIPVKAHPSGWTELVSWMTFPNLQSNKRDHEFVCVCQLWDPLHLVG